MKLWRHIPLHLFSSLIMALLVWNSAAVVLAQVEEVVAEETVNLEVEESLDTATGITRGRRHRVFPVHPQAAMEPPKWIFRGSPREVSASRYLLGRNRINGCGAFLRL